MRLPVSLLATIVAASFAAGAGAPSAQAPPTRVPTDARDPLLNQGPKREATGAKVMVSTQLPIVTDAAVKVLREGGNAVDAMVTAVFLQHVNDYHQVMQFG
jgi:gamma-glutamyltranspeptidase